LFCVVLCIVCVYMCTVLLPLGGYPIAVNKYIISSYHIISYHIISYHIIHTCEVTNQNTDSYYLSVLRQWREETLT